MKIITNNPLIRQELKDKFTIEYINCDYMGILIKCRDYIHKNYKLLTHPLSGSVKPNETPYKSIALGEGDSLDVEALMLIEKSIDTANKFNNNFKTPNWNEKILKDFQIIDYDLLNNAIQNVNFVR
ncbi:GrdX family protein [Tepidibacter formicigenes]|nr:GrdX family protein [Tepidibacter formicigenes]